MANHVVGPAHWNLVSGGFCCEILSAPGTSPAGRGGVSVLAFRAVLKSPLLLLGFIVSTAKKVLCPFLCLGTAAELLLNAQSRGSAHPTLTLCGILFQSQGAARHLGITVQINKSFLC